MQGNNEFLPDGRRVLRDNDVWTKVPYQVSFGNTFATVAQQILWAVEEYNTKYNALDMFRGRKINSENDYLKRGPMPPVSPDEANKYLVSPLEFIGRPYYKDTRLGCNDAYNAFPQYNRDDDIVHPTMVTQYIDDRHQIGMGRVYAETIQKNQQICWFTFGIPRFTALATFYLNAFNKQAVDINNMGYAKDFNWDNLFNAFGTVAALAITIPITPLCWIHNFAKHLLDHPINKYYDIRATMPLYYRYVDGILAHWLVNTGMYTNGHKDGNFSNNVDPLAQDNPESKDYGTLWSAMGDLVGSWTASNDSLPIALRYIGVSMFDIIDHKIALREGTKGSKVTRSGATYLDSLNAGSMALKNGYGAAADALADAWDPSATMWENLGSSALGAAHFVGFRVEKNVDSSESFSNSTTTSSAAEKINSSSQEAAAKAFDAGLSNGGANTGIALLDGFINGIKTVTDNIFESFGLSDIATVSTGVSIDIPERYSGSDFSKSHSLNFQLRSPYGDPVSIYQNIIVPLALLMAGSLPRAAGPNSYMSPFLTRVYCKGMFSIPLGIIDNISIKRGSSEYGWTYSQLPTCIDVSISIKDLATAMYCPIETAAIPNLLGSNNSFAEYMLTLAGVGLWERVSLFANTKRRIQRAGYALRNHTFNPNYWTNHIGDWAGPQLVAAFWPDTAINRN